MELQNKIVLVTGASSGIGEATAVAFAKKGATVLINYRNNNAGAESVLKKVQEYSEGAIFQADLQDENQVSLMFKQIIDTYQNIDILVNNAGQASAAPSDDISSWQFQFENILLSAVHCTNQFLSQTTGHRKILNTTSIYGERIFSSEYYPQYSAMKSALSSFTVTTAKQQQNNNVQVNAVAPGWTKTPAYGNAPKERIESIANRLSIQRMITADEIAHAFVFLAENDAVNGQIIQVDGGLFFEKE